MPIPLFRDSRVAGVHAVMVVTCGGIVLGELAREQGAHGVIGSTGAACVDVDARSGEGILCPHAHATAEQRINAPVLEHAREGTMPLPLCVFDFGGLDGTMIDGIDLERLGLHKLKAV